METQADRLIPEMRRGVVQIAVLTLLVDQSYGYALCKRLSENGFPVEEGTLYPILRRFEEQGIVASIWNTEGPRPRKYYQITPEGRSLLRKLSDEWKEMSASLGKIIQNAARKKKAER